MTRTKNKHSKKKCIHLKHSVTTAVDYAVDRMAVLVHIKVNYTIDYTATWRKCLLRILSSILFRQKKFTIRAACWLYNALRCCAVSDRLIVKRSLYPQSNRKNKNWTKKI